MSAILTAINQFAQSAPKSVAIEGEHIHLSYHDLLTAVETLACILQHQDFHCLGLLMDNSPAWVIFDLAAQKAGITLVPIPPFFSPQQIQHSLMDAEADVLITDQIQRITQLMPELKSRPMINVAAQRCWQIPLPVTADKKKITDISKITYTSGTTGTPKGVCLSQKTMDEVAKSLSQAIHITPQDRHLSLLPLAVLLENIGGVYAPLLSGACCIIPSLERAGLSGATNLDAKKMTLAIINSQASSIILLPQMLKMLLIEMKTETVFPKSLRFVAVGGAPVSTQLLTKAKNLGLPVFEGYGLSECASVVAVNTPDHHRLGSVGKVLPQIQVSFNNSGEIMLSGNLFDGYLKHEYQANDDYASGDLGYLDDDGYLYLTGRKKNCFITSFGRNVAPEWIEKELTCHHVIAQAVVFGEARPYNIALITARQNKQHIVAAIKQANTQLPDYARLSAWLYTDEPFSMTNQQLTANGRPRREIIWTVYEKRINQIYQQNERSQNEIL